MKYKTFFTALIGGIVLGMLSLLIDWLLGKDKTSPFGEYFLWHVELPNIWMQLNFPAYMGRLLTGTRSSGFFTFLQWFVIGSFGAQIVRFLLGLVRHTIGMYDERDSPSQRLR
jgi:hypothetical protein